MLSIGVLISAHTPRWRDGKLMRAMESIASQERLPDAVAIAVDHSHEGAAATKQRALESLQTEWVCVLDSDDYFLPWHIRIHEEAQLETGSDLVYSWFEGNDPFPEHFYSAPWDDASPRHTTTTIMARREMMLRVGYSADPVPGALYEDDDWRMTSGLLALGARVHHISNRSWFWDNSHGTNTSGRGDRWL